MDLMYVIGEPGVGKSTFVNYLTDGLPHESTDRPFGYRVLDCGQGRYVYELGVRRPDFPGTDALGMAVQPDVVAWLDMMRPGRVLAEGDRLGNAKFLHAARAMGYTLHVVALAGADVAERQRRLRGSDQSPAWLKGRQTKILRLVETFDVQTIRAGGRLSDMAAELSNPVIDALRAGRKEVSSAVL